jgi:hypothetical protein
VPTLSHSEVVRETALNLARMGAIVSDAVVHLRASCADRRVSAVIARQQLLAEAKGGDEIARRASQYLTELLAEWPP